MAVVAGLIGSGFMGKTHALALANVNHIFDLPVQVELHMLADIDSPTVFTRRWRWRQSRRASMSIAKSRSRPPPQIVWK